MNLTEFYDKVARKLGVLAVGEQMSADDADMIRGSYRMLVSLLEFHKLATWDADEPVPDHLAQILIDMVAAHLVDEFELPEPRRSTLRAEGMFGAASATLAERRLRAVLAVPYWGEPATTDYF